MPEAQETILEIDLGALAHNYTYIRSQVSPEVKFMAVIKAFAYGNDAMAMAKKLEELGANYFAVAYIQEGIALRKAGITKPVLVLHPQKPNFKDLIDHCLEPSLFGKNVLNEFLKTAEELNQKDYPVHLKFNTGMNRLGFPPKDVDTVLARISETSSVKVASVFSHLAASEDWREREFTLSQIHSFKKLASQCVKKLGYRPLLHLCNTSAIFNFPGATLDMVRCGIGLYGFANDENIDKNLKPVGTLKTTISQIQYLEEGETVGYNRAYKAEQPAKTATLPLGHADGINRKYGNGNAGVFVNGKYAPIIGNVCMDILMIDVTGIECNEGDEVIVFGGPQHATSFAKAGNTISYELIAGISQRVKRKIIEG